MPDKIVYTCITGKYDYLKEPEVVTSGWRYVCFYDELPDHEEGTIWELTPIGLSSPDSFPNLPIVKTQRITKICGGLLDPLGTMMIWVDGSVVINCDMDSFWDDFVEDGDFAIMDHPHRNCVFEEIEACRRGKKDSDENLDQVKAHMIRAMIDKNEGMIASGIYAKRITPIVRNFCFEWASHILEGSHRDQLYFNLTMKGHALESDYALIAWDSIIGSKFKLLSHRSKRP